MPTTLARPYQAHIASTWPTRTDGRCSEATINRCIGSTQAPVARPPSTSRRGESVATLVTTSTTAASSIATRPEAMHSSGSSPSRSCGTRASTPTKCCDQMPSPTIQMPTTYQLTRCQRSREAASRGAMSNAWYTVVAAISGATNASTTWKLPIMRAA